MSGGITFGQKTQGVIGGILGVLGQGVKDKQQIEQYRTQRNIANYNAQVSLVAAEDSRRRSRFEAKRQLVEGDSLESLLQARLGMSGVAADLGAPLELVAEQAAEFDLDRQITLYEGEQDARRYESQSAIDTMDAKQYDRAATGLRRSRYLRSATAFFGGGGGALFMPSPDRTKIDKG